LFQFKIAITEYSPQTKVSFSPKARKGSLASLDDLRHVALPMDVPTDCELSLLVGTMNTIFPQSHALRLRWHKVEAAASMKDGQAMALHAALTKLLPRGGFEAMRQGGSSGATAVNEHFFQFLSHDTSFPRKANRVKLIRRGFGWDAIYMKPWHGMREAIAFNRYSQPQPGGSFHLPPGLLKKFPVLLEFIKLKIYTAQILALLNSQHGYALQPLAARATLDDLKEAQELSGDVVEILCLVSCKNMYSMVCYPVGYHVDTFAGNKASLENKICFIMKSWKGTRGCGRGGAGPNKYVWALLDWGTGAAGERRRQYLAMGGNARSRVTKQVWDNFLAGRRNSNEN
jgi:hypothetical protein